MNLSALAKSIVRTSPDKVFEAFVDPAQMQRFWFHRKDSGLRVNETVTFYLGDAEDAFGFSVEVIDLKPAELIHIKWGDEGSGWTDVRWTLEATENGDTILTIEETGFVGTEEEIVSRALDSTGGFNQVIIAAKALLEHGAAINVVSDHA